MNLDDEALEWHQSYKKCRESIELPNWDEYLAALDETFSEEFYDPMDCFWGEKMDRLLAELPIVFCEEVVVFGSGVKLLGYGVLEVPVHSSTTSSDENGKCNARDFSHGKFYLLKGVSEECKFSSTKAVNKMNGNDVQLFMLQVLFTEPALQLTNQLNVLHLPQEFQTHVVIEELLSQYHQVFAKPTTLPPQRGAFDHSIPLIPGTKPINIRPYMYSSMKKDIIEKLVKDILQQGVIQYSNSHFASPVVLVGKKDSSWRLYVDYMELNQCIVKDKIHIPIIDDLLHELAGTVVFSKIDLRSALTTSPVLALPDYSTPFVVETDASGTGIGAVLMQHGYPIAFISKVLSPRHLALSVYERELLALVFALTKWSHYLLGQYFIVKTDQKALNTKRERKMLLQIHFPELMVFLDTVFKLHLRPLLVIGIPYSSSSFWKEFLSAQGVTLHTSTAYHPQTDGQSEVLNRCLETYSRYFCTDSPADWGAFLSIAEWWYNSSPHSAIQPSPFELLYGYPPLIHLPYLLGDSFVDVVKDFILVREFKLQLAKFHLCRAQRRMQAQTNSHKSDKEFQVGDWVFVKLQPYRQSTLSISSYHKLTFKYFAPYPIIERVGLVAYKLLLPLEVQIHPTLHISQLKFCYDLPTEIVHPPILNLASPLCLLPTVVLGRKLI
ncbi:uncharacterized protein [Nicotiana tomentosiformis]|uniref:uncharacterized protein n=1 Tax=Nicotiana tomentosiformis TaxID=4098 RepID=UPI00388C90FF